MPFRHKPIDPLELLKVVVSEIPSIVKSERLGDWTEATKQVLCRLGKKQRDITVYASTHLGDEKLSEWLLDIVWYSPSKGGIQLAVESELGKGDDVLDDFEKLMCVKSPLKLLLSELGESRMVQQVQDLEQYLIDFEQHMEGETYLLVDFAYGSHRCYKFVVPRPKNGKLKENEVKFDLILSGQDAAQKASAATH
jgi:hypothetical protein